MGVEGPLLDRNPGFRRDSDQGASDGEIPARRQTGHDLIPDQIAQWERDLAEANQRLNDLLGP
jgi:hypothetical protein